MQAHRDDVNGVTFSRDRRTITTAGSPYTRTVLGVGFRFVALFSLHSTEKPHAASRNRQTLAATIRLFANSSRVDAKSVGPIFLRACRASRTAGDVSHVASPISASVPAHARAAGLSQSP